MIQKIFAGALGILMLSTGATGQNGAAAKGNAPTTKSVRPPIPQTIVDMQAGTPIVGMPSFDVVINPMQCAADGTTYLETFDMAHNYVRTLYAVSTDGTVQKIARGMMPGFDPPQMFAVYPGDDEIVTLLSTTPSKPSGGKPVTGKPGYYLMVSDRKGVFQRLIPLDLRIDPVNVAVLSSGKFVVLGVETLNGQPELDLVDTDGKLVRPLDIEGTRFGSSQALLKVYGEKRSDIHSVHSGATLAPFRDNVLLLQNASRLPIYEIGVAGILRSVTVGLPDGYLLDSLVTSDSNWLVRAKRMEDIRELVTTGVSIGKEQLLFEVSSFDGSVIRQIVPAGVRTGEIMCGVNGALTALHFEFHAKEDGIPSKWLFRQGNIH